MLTIFSPWQGRPKVPILNLILLILAVVFFAAVVAVAVAVVVVEGSSLTLLGGMEN